MRGKSCHDVFCAKIEIEHLIKSYRNNFLDEHCRSILKFAHRTVESLEETAKRTLPSDLDKTICSAVPVITDVVQLIALKLKRPDLGIQFSAYVVQCEQKMAPLILPVKEMEEHCSDGLYSSYPDDEEEEEHYDDSLSSSKIIGVSEEYEELKEKVMKNRVTALVGMPGIGKTALARELLKDEIIKKSYHCVWVRVGKKCGLKDIMRRAIAEMDLDSSAEMVLNEDDAVLKSWKAITRKKTYLIVLDDVWDNNMLFLLVHYYKYGKMSNPFFDSLRQGRILFTTRLQQDDGCGRHLVEDVVTMRLLNKQESWDLLREKVFSGGLCPLQLEKAGKKIAKNCEGLPLTILTLADLLSGVDKTPERWNEMAKKRRHQLFLDAYDIASELYLLTSTLTNVLSIHGSIPSE